MTLRRKTCSMAPPSRDLDRGIYLPDRTSRQCAICTPWSQSQGECPQGIEYILCLLYVHVYTYLWASTQEGACSRQWQRIEYIIAHTHCSWGYTMLIWCVSGFLSPWPALTRWPSPASRPGSKQPPPGWAMVPPQKPTTVLLASTASTALPVATPPTCPALPLLPSSPRAPLSLVTTSCVARQLTFCLCLNVCVCVYVYWRHFYHNFCAILKVWSTVCK